MNIPQQERKHLSKSNGGDLRSIAVARSGDRPQRGLAVARSGDRPQRGLAVVRSGDRPQRFFAIGSKRRGAAAAEFAMIAPVLVLLVMGAIDVGQFVNVGQIVSNASREGAREATRVATTTTAEVDASIREYLQECFPNVSSSDLDSAVTIEFSDGNGNPVAGGDLTTIASGESVSVEVVLQFQAVRWMRGLNFLNGDAIETTTLMRRD